MSASATRALAWLQWRLLVNGLRGGRRRDTLEKASRWLDVAAPVVFAVLVIPLALLLLVFALVAGWVLVRTPQDASAVVIAASIVFLVPLAVLVIRPLAAARSGALERSELIRLLPVPRALLFNLEFVRAAADPIVMAFVPALFAVPVGALAAGAGMLALLVLGAGMAFALFLFALGGFIAIAAQLFLRDRRRAEAVALVFMFALMLASLAPQLIVRDRARERAARTPVAAAPAPRTPAPSSAKPVREVTLPAPLRLLPSFAYGAALEQAASGRPVAAAGYCAGLALLAVVCYGLALPLQRRLLETPARSGPGARAARVRGWSLPFIPAPVVAVAAVQARTILRTVRGRWAMIGPPLVALLFALVFSRQGGRGPAAVFGSSLFVWVFAIFFALESLAVVSANQFAADGFGFALLALQPLPARTLVRGKALGIGALKAASMTLTLLPPALVLRPFQGALVLVVVLGGVASIALSGPIEAALSALFPKRVDLSRWSRAANPHALAGLGSFFANGLMALPAAGAFLFAAGVLHRPWLAPPLVAGWLLVAAVLAHAAYPVAERIFSARRENLALVVFTD